MAPLRRGVTRKSLDGGTAMYQYVGMNSTTALMVAGSIETLAEVAQPS